MANVLQRLIKAIRNAAACNPNVQAAPWCILWPDRDNQWEAVAARLQSELPEMFILGVYDAGKKTGPAIWLRCVIAGKVPNLDLPKGSTPILYLPGVSRQDLRAVEVCPDLLKPLVELQYRGTVWTQLNGKDWTILAFLKSDQGGLGFDVAQDQGAKTAMQLALHRVLEEDVELLADKRLDKDYFNSLLIGGDPVRDLLRWIDDSADFQLGRSENEWQAFGELLRSKFAFDPDQEGLLTAVDHLARHTGPWQPVWERFCEAPHHYPHIPAQIRKCLMPPSNLLTDATTHSGWPQWNEERERQLRLELRHLEEQPPHEARKVVLALESCHAERRDLVWAELGDAPLAQALEHLGRLAEITTTPPSAGTAQDMADHYRADGWRADDACLRALEWVESSEDRQAVTVAIRAMYLPWLEESARRLQKAVEPAGYPGGDLKTAAQAIYRDGECVLFVDGLRFDLGKRLAEQLRVAGCLIEESPRWAALPSVTPTGKAAVSPVREHLTGYEYNVDFEPCVAESRQSLKGGNPFHKLLSEQGWTVLDDVGKGEGRGWYECGRVDQEGHHLGELLPRHVDELVREIRGRVVALLAAGWKAVRIVTDHGWLLMPGGLPKTELDSVLTENKWGRCAVIKPGAETKAHQYPWYWNPNQYFALAEGISCFKKGMEYAHGGLSLQECLTLELTVSPGKTSGQAAPCAIAEFKWKGLRCSLAVEGSFHGLWADLRTRPGDAASSVVISKKGLKDDGTASLVVETEELQGKKAVIVLLDEQDGLVAQTETVIGGEHS